MLIYALNADQTMLTFAVRGLLPTRGRFIHMEGTVTVDEHDQPQSLEVVIPVRGLSTGLAPRDLHLKSATFFDARRFPLIRYSAQHFAPVGEQRYRVLGELQMHGRSHPVTLDAVLQPGGGPEQTQRAHVTGVVPRRRFGIPRNPLLRALLRAALGDNVAITIEVAGMLVREGSTATSAPFPTLG